MTHFFDAMGAFPAHVLVRAQSVGKAATDADELTALAKAAAPDPSVIDDDSLYLWGAEISNNSLDSYFTRMGKSSLKQYADDANMGVAFLTGHNTRNLPMGKSIRGKFTNSNGDGKARVEADFYTITDLNVNGVGTNDFIRGVRAGVISDVSIGFHGGEWICNICGKDMARWWQDYPEGCNHLPGMEYSRLDKKGKETGEMVLCVADIENAGLSEVSAVYDGATPGASIRKALSMAEAGKLPLDVARRMEERYRHRFKLAPETQWSLGTVQKDERMTARRDQPLEAETDPEPIGEAETPITPTEVSTEPAADASPSDAESKDNAETPTPDAGESSATTEPAGPDEGDTDMELTEELKAAFADSGVEALPDAPAEAARALVAEIKRLRPLADDGRAYRADLTTAALKEGVRAFGSTFAEEKRRATFAKLDIAEIKDFHDEWKAMGDARAAGGRVTVDGSPAEGAEGDAEGDAEREAKVLDFTPRTKANLPASAFSS